MFNRKFTNVNANFDPNYYEFEKKKQIIENKAKEKERLLLEQENKKNTIQINFKNTYINKSIQKKYDEIIQNNNKRNQEKLDERTLTKKIKSNNNNDNNDTIDTYLVTGIYIFSLKKIFLENESKNKKIDNNQTTNTYVNQSEYLYIEQMSTQKSKIEETFVKNSRNLNNSSLDKTDINPIIDKTYISQSNNKTEIDNLNGNNFNCTENTRINYDNSDINATLKYESDNDATKIKNNIYNIPNRQENYITKNTETYNNEKINVIKINNEFKNNIEEKFNQNNKSSNNKFSNTKIFDDDNINEFIYNDQAFISTNILIDKLFRTKIERK